VQAGHFPAERRPLQLQNAQQALAELARVDAATAQGVKCEALVDGDRAATLDFLWALFLHFQVSLLSLSLLPLRMHAQPLPFMQ
jgi:hypothetical protein